MADNQGQVNLPVTGDLAIQNLPINFAIKYADVNVNRAVEVEPDKETIILINLTKNIITPVR
jgi:hypothetical protein